MIDECPAQRRRNIFANPMHVIWVKWSIWHWCTDQKIFSRS